jgi:hypothetical protein
MAPRSEGVPLDFTRDPTSGGAGHGEAESEGRREFMVMYLLVRSKPQNPADELMELLNGFAGPGVWLV